MANKRKRKQADAAGLDCRSCGALCCRYVALEIDKPETPRDYDNIRWYLLHERVHVFVDEDGGWYVEFDTDCTRLGPDGRCGIYATRPRICRDYGRGDTVCEYHGETKPYRYRFSDVESFERWLDRKHITWRRKRKRAEN